MPRGSSALLLLAFVCVAQAQPPRIRIEATDAYVVSKPGHPVAGPALDLSEAVLQRAGLAYSVEIAPWARAFSIASKEPYVLLFTAGRTPEREPHFHWIGPTFPLEYHAYRLTQRDDVVVKSLEDLRRYRISVVRDSAIVPQLRKLNLPEDRIDGGMQFIAAAEDHWPKLEHGRVDLFVTTSQAVNTMCLRGDFDCARISTAWIFSEPRLMAWIALSETTPADVVIRVADAYRSLKSDGSFDRLMGPALKAGER